MRLYFTSARCAEYHFLRVVPYVQAFLWLNEPSTPPPLRPTPSSHKLPSHKRTVASSPACRAARSAAEAASAHVWTAKGIAATAVGSEPLAGARRAAAARARRSAGDGRRARRSMAETVRARLEEEEEEEEERKRAQRSPRGSRDAVMAGLLHCLVFAPSLFSEL